MIISTHVTNTLPEVLASKLLSTLTVKFDFDIENAQIPQFRSLINLLLGEENDLFHNHQPDGKVKYRYPLVQYKVIDGKACLLGIGEDGVAAVQSLLDQPALRTLISEQNDHNLMISSLETDDLMLFREPTQTYQISQWLALNEINARKWQDDKNMVARLQLLENTLAAHILKFCSAIRWQLPPKSLVVSLSECKERRVRFKGVPFMAFDVAFKTNIMLREYVGLGKGVSHGFGVVM